jgi:WD40 repeat protein
MRPVAFSPKDDFLAAGSDDGTVKIWSVAKLRQ